ncbi:lipopolysaccharide kinase (Kdo/WaaP) family protein [Kushneria sinocarnis]|uniref:Lipopolysaccharide kinase (Kdo/WaaP) family protein n=1 Tax=Kushneria sinocarnis TaxID=595502 RepID=A0A420WT99_9GAMM|nr:lipopolysaccharide kinase InaA family protein [Kushneria sinocarnis]RKQ96323.1 lipopolysaccharide kinase (Kdo/WaaP) family protein [Kushneria sinocarnis]
MKKFVAPQYHPLLKQHGLDDFEALWALDLTPVDAPNLERGGHSEVVVLTLETSGAPQRFFLKRQTNHLGRSLHRPLGEPTFAREMRNIRTFERLEIPALSAAWYGEHHRNGDWRAILMTPALDEYRDMMQWHQQWASLPLATRDAVIDSCASLLRRLHQRRWRHGSLYAKHVFLRPEQSRPEAPEARFIDLEKSRPLINGRRERLRDLELFGRRLSQWDDETWRRFLARYLASSSDSRIVGNWLQRLLPKLR